jgi:hypothetical protein
MKVSKKTHNQCNQIAIGGYTNERVSTFPCLGSVTNDDNCISEETTHRIKKGDRACYAYKGLINMIKKHLHDINKAGSDICMQNLDTVCMGHK